MIEVGKRQKLTVLRRKEFGVFLGEDKDDDGVLLPQKQVPEELEIGDDIEVFIYRDSQDRMIATVRQPKLTVGEIGCLEVVSVGSIGAFMDCGLERDILLPFREQTIQAEVGKQYPVYMYVDKSERLCVTMRLYSHLNLKPPYRKNDAFQGIVYDYKEHMGAFVVVGGQYSGLIPNSELYQNIQIGDDVEGRILNVREDGKLDLSIRRPAYLQIQVDAEKIMKRLETNGGTIPFTDKAAPEIIRQEFGMSKNEFKRVVGHLLKKEEIEITQQAIVRKADSRNE